MNKPGDHEGHRAELARLHQGNEIALRGWGVTAIAPRVRQGKRWPLQTGLSHSVLDPRATARDKSSH